jgi:large subunit ribosomal protein L17
LIEHQRIRTTLAKAKAVRPLAEKMVTLGKKASIHARRTAFAVLRQKDAVKKLFDEIAPRTSDRNGGYTRIVKLGQRKGDAAPIAYLEWVDAALLVDQEIDEAVEKKARKSKKEDEQSAGAEKKSKKKAAATAA